MADVEAQPKRPARSGVALAFAIAALACSWNPVGAPFGLIIGVAAGIFGARALRRAEGRRALPAAALSLGVVAALASVVVLLLTAGAVGVDLPGEPVVKGRTQQELEQVLSQAGERTRAQRERASKELDRLAPRAPAPVRDGGASPPTDAGSDAP